MTTKTEHIYVYKIFVAGKGGADLLVSYFTNKPAEDKHVVLMIVLIPSLITRISPL